MTSTGPTAPRSESQRERERKPSLIQLLGSVPTQVTDLVHREIDLIKTELITKLKSLGVGAGVLVGALVFVFGALGVLLTAAVLALSLVMPGWLAALLVALVLLIIAAVLGFIGYRTLKKGIPPVPTEGIDSLKRDIKAIKGTGKRTTS